MQHEQKIELERPIEASQLSRAPEEFLIEVPARRGWPGDNVYPARHDNWVRVAGVRHLTVEEAPPYILAGSRWFVADLGCTHRGEWLVLLHAQPDVTPANIVQQLNAAGLPPRWIRKRENIHVIDRIPRLGSGKLDRAKAPALAFAKVQTRPASELTVEA